jgi:predicted alpha/beta superfamily hydrolase
MNDFIKKFYLDIDKEKNLNIYRHSKNIKGVIKRHKFFSKTLGNKRFIDVYLPPGYYERLYKSYPVLYMHDGNNLFDPKISFGGVSWDVDLTVEYLTENNLIEEIIVVGISNSFDREYEYTWTPMYLDYDDIKQGGGGRKYSRFLVSELKPFIDNKYRTLPYRDTTAVMGSSLGAIISFYLGLYYPHVFSKVGMMSPSLWWGNGIVYKHAKNLVPNIQIWLDMGTKEYEGEIYENEGIESTRKFRDVLLDIGFIEGENLAYFEHEGAEHNERSWAKRLHLPLMYFFGK